MKVWSHPHAYSADAISSSAGLSTSLGSSLVPLPLGILSSSQECMASTGASPICESSRLPFESRALTTSQAEQPVLITQSDGVGSWLKAAPDLMQWCKPYSHSYLEALILEKHKVKLAPWSCRHPTSLQEFYVGISVLISGDRSPMPSTHLGGPPDIGETHLPVVQHRNKAARMCTVSASCTVSSGEDSAKRAGNSIACVATIIGSHSSWAHCCEIVAGLLNLSWVSWQAVFQRGFSLESSLQPSQAS